MIKTFINYVFVYDDKVVISFNYSGDGRTITINEIDAGLTIGIQLPMGVFHFNAHIQTIYIIKNVFVDHVNQNTTR